jgi:hypothetical protein
MAASLGEIMNSLVLAAAVFIIDGEVNVTDFKKSKSVQRAAAQFLQDAPPQFKGFIEEIGFRPMRDLDHIKFRMTQPINPDKPGEPLVTLKGRFKPKRIHSSWAKKPRQNCDQAAQDCGQDGVRRQHQLADVCA